MIFYNAYTIEGNQKVLVLDQIVEANQGWMWNCYNGFESKTKSEVVRKVLSCPNFLEPNLLDIEKYKQVKQTKFYFKQEKLTWQ